MMQKEMITEMSESYNRLKSDIKEKYTKMICADLESVRQYVISKSSEFLGEDFLRKLSEVEGLKKQCDNERKAFRATPEYVAAQKELSEASKAAKKIAKTDENADKEEIKRLNKAISSITTLNVTIKNRLKDKTDRYDKLSAEIDYVIRTNENSFKEINAEVLRMVKQAISDCLGGYAEELKVLNETFGVEETTDEDLPFDEKVIRLDIPVFGSREATKENDEGRTRTFIPSDDGNGILN